METSKYKNKLLKVITTKTIFIATSIALFAGNNKSSVGDSVDIVQCVNESQKGADMKCYTIERGQNLIDLVLQRHHESTLSSIIG